MSNWISLGSIEQFAAESATEVVVGTSIVAVIQVEEQFFAIDGICAHQGGPVGKGQMCGHVVTCPWHGWQYDVRSGKHELSEIHQQSFEVEIRDSELWINMPED
ncbi:MAG: ferredoxin [Blastopirellula sp.]|nr:MAG: ferredoxin [Blastopirellula sp.]